MPDYKEMYFTLLRANEQAINILMTAQIACEAMYNSQPEPELRVINTSLEQAQTKKITDT